MSDRLGLNEMLCSILGSRNVYYQPPESLKIQYPAIIYSLSEIDNIHADDDVYHQRKFYSITVVDKDPDSPISDKVSKLKTCRFDRTYSANNLHHWVYRILY